MPEIYDAVVIGSGPNGLAAAITLARAKLKVLVIEANHQIGGGTRSKELTLPGFVNDVCSAVHPLAIASPFFRSLPLDEFGLEWLHSPLELAHPLETDAPVLLHKSIEKTAAGLGPDEKSYRKFMQPFVDDWQGLMREILQPVLHFPKHPLRLARFGTLGLLSAERLARVVFSGPRARSLFAGIAAHANAPLTQPGTGAIGLMLLLAAHARGWPIPRGGSQKIADAMAEYFKTLGGEIQTDHAIESLGEIPESKLIFFDLVPSQILKIFKVENPPSELSKSRQNAFRKFVHGPGVFKMDWALAAPIPWRDKDCARAATVHLGGDMGELVRSESELQNGGVSSAPYVLLSQPSLFDATRAPQGGQVVWAYCHVPNGSTIDMSDAIETQIERFAPGFKKTIKVRHVMNTVDIQKHNRNLVGGDISGGAVNLRQLLFRPRFGLNPYAIQSGHYYICSSSTPPGPGVHGMCGFNAAMAALKFIK